jgi:uncharacterized RDD family membrane protein YckC
MDWYYAREGQQHGPVSETELAGLLRDGVIAPSTLVWHAGLAEWQSWSSVAPSGGFPPVVPNVSPPYGSSTAELPLSAAAAPGRFVYAGFWIRALAYVIDGALIGAIRSIVLIPMGLSMLDRPFASPWFFTHLGEAKFASLAISLAYCVYFWTQYGATPGKMLLKLRVVTPQGALISAGQAVGRYFAQMLSGILLGIGFMMAGWDDQKRALHDRLAETRVIRVND